MSEPQRIGEILPEVMQEITDRCNRYREENGLPSLAEERRSKQSPSAKASSERAFLAVQDFFSGQKPNKQNKRPGRKAKGELLFGKQARL